MEGCTDRVSPRVLSCFCLHRANHPLGNTLIYSSAWNSDRLSLPDINFFKLFKVCARATKAHGE